MDDYTTNTKTWLDNRFRECDESGIYYAHQPIYGFRRGHSEPGLFSRYLTTWQIMKALAGIKFDSFLDVGGAEGYKAYLVRQVFGVKVKNTDLSLEACNRAKEIFHVDSTPSDMHALPFEDNEFDAVLCSESLEHVSDLAGSMRELLRVAKRAIIITVPHETDEEIHANIESDIPHAHIHSFSLNSFDYLKEHGYTVVKKKVFSPLSKLSSALIEAVPKSHDGRKTCLNLIIAVYNALTPVLKVMIGVKSASFLIKLDELLCKIFSKHKSIMFIILKNDDYCCKSSKRKISLSKIINVSVPYFYLENKIT